MSEIPWRLRIADRLTSRLGTPLAELTPEQVRTRREFEPPPWARPFLAPLTGPTLPSVRIEDMAATGRQGRIPLRVYRPAIAAAGLPLPVLVFFHGGGWTLGTTRYYDPLCTRVADATECLVVSVDYRLAPENVAPAAIEDAVDATWWVARQADGLGGDPNRLGVMGDSAGGNLAAVVTQTARDARRTGHAEAPVIRHQVLIYPSVDASTLRPSRIAHADGPVLRRRDTDAFFGFYLGSAADRLTPTDPRISPLLGDLVDLPPALIQTADLDPLRDEGLEYARRLRENGTEVVVTNYPRAAHGFASMPGLTPHVHRHLAEIRREVRRHLGTAARPPASPDGGTGPTPSRRAPVSGDPTGD